MSANPNDAVRYAQAIVPNLKHIIAPPQNFRIEQRFRSDSKIHGDKPFSDSHLGRSDGATIAVGSAELVECRVQLTNFPRQFLVFRRSLCCRSLKARITDDQYRKWEKSESSEPHKIQLLLFRRILFCIFSQHLIKDGGVLFEEFFFVFGAEVVGLSFIGRVDGPVRFAQADGAKWMFLGEVG